MYRTEDLEQLVFADGEPDEETTLRDALEQELSPGVPEEFPALEFTLNLEDGRTLVCEAFGIFAAVYEGAERQYIALHPKEDTEGLIHLLRMEPGEDDELLLVPMEDDGEQQEAEQAFYRLFGQRD